MSFVIQVGEKMLCYPRISRGRSYTGDVLRVTDLTPNKTVLPSKATKFTTVEEGEEYLKNWKVLLANTTQTVPSTNYCTCSVEVQLPYKTSRWSSSYVFENIDSSVRLDYHDFKSAHKEITRLLKTAKVVPLNHENGIVLTRNINTIRNVRWEKSEKVSCGRCGLRYESIKMLQCNFTFSLCALCFKDLSAEGEQIYNALSPEFIDMYNRKITLKALEVK